MRWCILEVNPEGLGPEGLGWWSTNMFVYHFVDPEFGFEIFLKKKNKQGVTEKMSIDVDIGYWGTTAYLY